MICPSQGPDTERFYGTARTLKHAAAPSSFRLHSFPRGVVGVRVFGDTDWDRPAVTHSFIRPTLLAKHWACLRGATLGDWLDKLEISEPQCQQQVKHDSDPPERIRRARKLCQKGDDEADRVAHDDGEDNGS